MNERELIKKILSGEEKAFEQLMQQNQSSIFRHCLKMVKDEEIAEDLTQETFLQAYRHLASFKGEARFSTWLWRIAHNVSLNYLRKEPPYEKEYREEWISPSALIAPSEIDQELLQKIHSVLPKLPEKQRRVFELFDLQRIPQKEIAEKLGIPHGTVRSRVFYARKKIRQFLREV